MRHPPDTFLINLAQQRTAHARPRGADHGVPRRNPPNPRRGALAHLLLLPRGHWVWEARKVMEVRMRLEATDMDAVIRNAAAHAFGTQPAQLRAVAESELRHFELNHL